MSVVIPFVMEFINYVQIVENVRNPLDEKRLVSNLVMHLGQDDKLLFFKN